MKKLLAVLAAVAMVAMLAGCGSSDNTSSSSGSPDTVSTNSVNHTIIGTWNVVSMYAPVSWGAGGVTRPAGADSASGSYTFNADGTYHSNPFEVLGAAVGNGEWTSSGNALSMHDDNTGKTESLTYTISADGNTLTLDLLNQVNDGYLEFVFHRA